MINVTSWTLESDPLTLGQKKSTHDNVLMMSSHSTVKVLKFEFLAEIWAGNPSKIIAVDPGKNNFLLTGKIVTVFTKSWYIVAQQKVEVSQLDQIDVEVLKIKYTGNKDAS